MHMHVCVCANAIANIHGLRFTMICSLVFRIIISSSSHCRLLLYSISFITYFFGSLIHDRSFSAYARPPAHLLTPCTWSYVCVCVCVSMQYWFSFWYIYFGCTNWFAITSNKKKCVRLCRSMHARSYTMYYMDMFQMPIKMKRFRPLRIIIDCAVVIVVCCVSGSFFSWTT